VSSLTYRHRRWTSSRRCCGDSDVADIDHFIEWILGGDALRKPPAAMLTAAMFVFACGISAMTHVRADTPGTTTYGERSANAPKELEAFSFLIGKWEGTGKTKMADGKSAQFAATWIGRYILDGTAIADEFHSSAADGSPYLGISFRQYDRVKKAWIVEYLNVSNSFLRRQVNATSGSVSVDGKTVVVISEASDTWSREIYRVESHDRFTYAIDLSHDGGRTWNVAQIEMHFSRKE
jgi:Protein of unknown function (DUF1579)